jgi:hypothetical protein
MLLAAVLAGVQPQAVMTVWTLRDDQATRIACESHDVQVERFGFL